MTGMKNTLHPRLAVLAKSGARRFDPVRFCYIESMARRAREKKGVVRQIIERKAIEALDDYQDRFDKARVEAAKTVDHVASHHPDSAEQTKKLFEEFNFRGVQKLAERLKRGQGLRKLITLKTQIRDAGAPSAQNTSQCSLDDLMRQQEQDVMQSIGDIISTEKTTLTARKEELKSFNLFKETLTSLNADRRVGSAIKEHPKDPGPLNAQMLVTQTLSNMRDLSPPYLSRFVSHIDTLLWLERV